MAETIVNRLRHAWNAFKDGIPQNTGKGSSYNFRPDRVRLNLSSEKSIISAAYTRISIDVSNIQFKHIRLDENERFIDIIDSYFNECLTNMANVDQTSRSFIQDVVISLLDEGVVAIVPVDTTIDPTTSTAYDILSMRTAKIIEWFPYEVRVDIYNEQSSRREQIVVPKKDVAIIENPLYMVMNEANSTFKRLVNKLNLLDAIDQQSGSGKLDLLIQFPYVIKTPARRQQAETRRKDIEAQLSGSKYGIAYTDGTEKITQLNRPAENNLMKQIEYLTSMLYSQLGITPAVLDGTADEKTMLNYFNRTVDPIAMAISDGMKSKFLTKTGRSQGQSVKGFRDPFRLVPVSEISDVADKFTRNEILTTNEIRGIIGYKPSKEKGADELRNKNLNPVETQPPADNNLQKIEKTQRSNNGKESV